LLTHKKIPKTANGHFGIFYCINNYQVQSFLIGKEAKERLSHYLLEILRLAAQDDKRCGSG
jgi:hypothetical protein